MPQNITLAEFADRSQNNVETMRFHVTTNTARYSSHPSHLYNLTGFFKILTRFDVFALQMILSILILRVSFTTVKIIYKKTARNLFNVV